MGKDKLKRFAEVATFPNVFQNFNLQKPALVDFNREVVALKGRWKEVVFKNDNPITLELACGTGAYTVELAEKYPDRNFIGIDIKGARIWRGAKDAIEKGITNVAFCRTRIEQINYFFAANEISEIWITFPDPFYSKPNRRLTYINFLNVYQQILKADGLLHLKTDDLMLYEFSLESLEENNCPIFYQNDDIYANPLAFSDLEIKTKYEKSHLANGRTIKYLRFGLPATDEI
jgi:tRNA (guanine-N7-)-methyltransferase